MFSGSGSVLASLILFRYLAVIENVNIYLTYRFVLSLSASLSQS